MKALWTGATNQAPAAPMPMIQTLGGLSPRSPSPPNPTRNTSRLSSPYHFYDFYLYYPFFSRVSPLPLHPRIHQLGRTFFLNIKLNLSTIQHTGQLYTTIPSVEYICTSSFYGFLFDVSFLGSLYRVVTIINQMITTSDPIDSPSNI